MLSNGTFSAIVCKFQMIYLLNEIVYVDERRSAFLFNTFAFAPSSLSEASTVVIKVSADVSLRAIDDGFLMTGGLSFTSNTVTVTFTIAVRGEMPASVA